HACELLPGAHACLTLRPRVFRDFGRRQLPGHVMSPAACSHLPCDGTSALKVFASTVRARHRRAGPSSVTTPAHTLRRSMPPTAKQSKPSRTKATSHGARRRKTHTPRRDDEAPLIPILARKVRETEAKAQKGKL